MEKKVYDAVVIGSGLGGLTAAALLAKRGRNVCVLERNSSPGGAASQFKFGALTIEASLHQTSDPHDPRDAKHDALRELGLLDDIEWLPVSPIYSIQGGPLGDPFELPPGFDNARAALQARFAENSQGIASVLGRIERVVEGVAELTRARAEGSLSLLMKGAMKLRTLPTVWRSSLEDMLAQEFGGNEALKLAFAGNLTYYADDPARLWWLHFALAQGSFLASGGTFIKGGSRTLTMRLARVVNRSGGSVRLNRNVTSIQPAVAGGNAVVRHVDSKSNGDEEQIEARMVLANCAPSAVTEMLSGAERSAFEKAYGGKPLSVSLFTAHFGVKAPPSSFGLRHYSTILLPGWMRALREFPQCTALLSEGPGDRMPALGIANHGAISGGLSDDGPTLISVVGSDRLSNWSGLAPEVDKDRRARWLDAIQQAVDSKFPGFANAVTDRMFLSARSMQGFLHTPGGAVYGFEPSAPTRGMWSGLPRSPATPVPGLYLASSFGGGGGFTGAVAAGAEAARVATAGS